MTLRALAHDPDPCELCNVGLAKRYIGGRLMCLACADIVLETEHHNGVNQLWIAAIEQARIEQRNQQIGTFLVGLSNVCGFLLLVAGVVAFVWLMVKP